MLLRELQYQIMRNWQRWADLEVFVNVGDELIPLADTDVDDNSFVLIPEANIGAYKKTKSNNCPECGISSIPGTDGKEFACFCLQNIDEKKLKN